MALHSEIETFIKTFNVQNYLEIGLGDGINFLNLDVPFKTGISPSVEHIDTDSVCVHEVTSDIGFQLIQDKTFDLIFIDGLHEYKQVVRDINNALKLLSDDGFIIIHDVNCLADKPAEVFVKREFHPGGFPWCGDVWKAVFHIAWYIDEVRHLTIHDQDWCGFTVLWKDTEDETCVELTTPDNQYPCESFDRKYAMCNSHVFNFTTLESAIETTKHIRGIE